MKGNRGFCQFSFIVTCYNFARYLPECLDSLVYQNYGQEDYEIICVDDGSTDESPSIVERYRKRFANFIPVHLENSGLEKACNAGVRASRCPWVVRADADDRMDPDFLKVMDRAVHDHPESDFFYCQEYFERHSETGRHRKRLPDFDSEEIFHRGDFFATGTVFRKEDLAQIGYYPEEIKNCGLENYSVVLSLLKKGKRGLAVPGTWFDYRRHEQNLSTLKRQSILEFGRRLLQRYGRPFVTNENHPYGLKIEAEETKR